MTRSVFNGHQQTHQDRKQTAYHQREHLNATMADPAHPQINIPALLGRVAGLPPELKQRIMKQEPSVRKQLLRIAMHNRDMVETFYAVHRYTIFAPNRRRRAKRLANTIFAGPEFAGEQQYVSMPPAHFPATPRSHGEDQKLPSWHRQAFPSSETTPWDLSSKPLALDDAYNSISDAQKRQKLVQYNAARAADERRNYHASRKMHRFMIVMHDFCKYRRLGNYGKLCAGCIVRNGRKAHRIAVTRALLCPDCA
ncbi:hypothetical protein Q7P37_004496 [Cladosporium fusiforme]